MSTQIDIKFNPQGFAECLNGMDGMVQSVAEDLAAKAASELQGPGSYTVEVVHETRFQDASYGVTRPVAVARVIADADATRDEAENKTMSKAVY